MGKNRLPMRGWSGTKFAARAGLVALLVLIATSVATGQARAQAGAASPEWLLNAAASHFYMETVKASSIFEVHQFTGLEGGISKDGDAEVKIDLTSISSGIDVRDVRMRFLLFETYKFPTAEITAKLDMTALQPLLTATRINYPLKVRVALHGETQDMDAPVTITRLNDHSVAVTSAKPIVVKTDAFGLTGGIAKLSEAVNGTVIATGATITFDLVFETGDKIPALEAARDDSIKRKAEVESAPISADACETRLSVISTAGAIYFKTNSAELDDKSAPILRSIADIANRCPATKIEVTGHTDASGDKSANLRLSDQRAHAVASFLAQHGVGAERVQAIGYGDTHPIAPNDTELNRAKNRRIEFRVVAH
jgi:OmpA-OmpF porin, OOP family